LASVTATGKNFADLKEYEDVIKEELNVKQVILKNRETVKGDPHPELQIITLDDKITPELKREGLMREVIRHVQAARKQAGLNVDDRIVLQLVTTNEELAQAISEHESTIMSETLTSELGTAKDGYQTDVKIEAHPLKIALHKHV
jgi:isoleucyl-tRNA synthetase